MQFFHSSVLFYALSCCCFSGLTGLFLTVPPQATVACRLSGKLKILEAYGLRYRKASFSTSVFIISGFAVQRSAPGFMGKSLRLRVGMGLLVERDSRKFVHRSFAEFVVGEALHPIGCG